MIIYIVQARNHGQIYAICKDKTKAEKKLKEITDLKDSLPLLQRGYSYIIQEWELEE